MNQEIILENVDFSYNQNFKVLQDINLSVNNQEFVAILGPSGCGKTTLLKMIGGLFQPTSGKILIQNKPVQHAKKNKFFGFVFQDHTLLPWKTVIENIELPCKIIKYPTANCEDLLKLIKLQEFKNKYPHQLSGGMKQRVAIARALSFNPRIMLMDEPFGSLDDITREYLNIELLRIWQNIKNTVVFVTHSIPEAVFLADKVIVLSDRPGTIKKIIDIRLPRPRDINMKYTPEFNSLVKNIRGYLDYED
jgi:NitT/TauT family transport system ATP-binding protein